MNELRNPLEGRALVIETIVRRRLVVGGGFVNNVLYLLA